MRATLPGGFPRGWLVADLLRNDVLYIPPFWFHHVETFGAAPSLSLSVWSAGAEQLAVARALRVPFLSPPAGLVWNVTVRQGMARRLVWQTAVMVGIEPEEVTLALC